MGSGATRPMGGWFAKPLRPLLEEHTRSVGAFGNEENLSSCQVHSPHSDSVGGPSPGLPSFVLFISLLAGASSSLGKSLGIPGGSGIASAVQCFVSRSVGKGRILHPV